MRIEHQRETRPVKERGRLRRNGQSQTCEEQRERDALRYGLPDRQRAPGSDGKADADLSATRRRTTCFMRASVLERNVWVRHRLVEILLRRV